VERFPRGQCFSRGYLRIRALRAAESFIRHSGPFGQNGNRCEESAMKRSGVLIATAALGAALLASVPAEARGGGGHGGGGGHAGGSGGGHIGGAGVSHGGMFAGRSAAVGGVNRGGFTGRHGNFRRFGYPYGYGLGWGNSYWYGCNPYYGYSCAYPY
jgi:hypothetical protein